MKWMWWRDAAAKVERRRAQYARAILARDRAQDLRRQAERLGEQLAEDRRHNGYADIIRAALGEPR